jgi:hypothetical protein
VVAHREAGRRAAAVRPGTSSRHLRREAVAVCRDAAGVRSVRHRQEASSLALWREESPPEARPSAALLSRAVLPWGLRPASPASASDAYRPEQALELAARLAQARWLPPEVVSVSGVPAVPRSEAAVVVGSHGPAGPRAEEEEAAVLGVVAAPRQAAAESDAVVRPREVAAEELDAAAVPQQAAASDGAAVLQQAAAEAAVWGAAAEPQRAVEQVAGWDVAEPRWAAPVA